MTQTLYFPGLNWQIEFKPRCSSRLPDYGQLVRGNYCSGLFGCYYLFFPRMKKFGLNEDRTLDVIIAGIIGGIVGARLYYVIFAFDEFKGDPLKIFRIWEGGLAIYGGIIGAILVGWLFCYIRKVKFLPLLDMVGSGFLIGQAIGRWGNFVNIEAFGSNTTLPWA